MIEWIALSLLFNTVFRVSTLSDEMPGLLINDSGLQSVENSSKGLDRFEFAVQETILRRASELKQELTQGFIKPFPDIIEANVGDATTCGQKQITFIRQVTALACLPELLYDSTFPSDVRTRVSSFLQNCQGNSIGSLTNMEGSEMVRRHIAQYIHRRDGHHANWQDIIIFPGISAAVKILHNLMNFSSNGHPVGVMTPVPEFPSLIDYLTNFGIQKAGYFLSEENSWSIELDELERALSVGKLHCCVRALVIINPGNPSGQVLTRQNIENIIKFAAKENLLIIACEVYQDNVYHENVFHSFKKVMMEMQFPYNQTELVSLMSCPTGYAGESGLKAGYMELHNIDPSTRDMLRSHIMIADLPPVCAQIALDCIANPPQPGEPSFPLFHQERTAFLTSAGERASRLYNCINSIPGLSCQPVQGAFFAFVKVDIPEKAVEEANNLNQCPSTFYVLKMLESSGVVVVPGSGFGQKPGTYHFRISILLSEEKLEEALQRIRKFHLNFMEQYK